MSTSKVTFPSRHSGTLVGRLHEPGGPPRAYALFAHCFTCSKDLKPAVRISEALANRGVATLRFDFAGIGESDGDFANTNFSSNVDDLIAAADFLRDRYTAPQLLIGHSWGGSAVLAAAERIAEALAVVTIGAPFDPAHVSHLIDVSKETLEKQGEADVQIAGRHFRVKKQFLDDLEDQKSKTRVASLDKALLIFHSPVDKVVGIENARLIYEAARHPKSFLSLDDADHLLLRPSDSEYVADTLASWAQRYLTQTPDRPEHEARYAVRVHGGSSGYGQSIEAAGHRLRADEPRSVGGTDSGPDPYRLVLAGLGACTSITLRMYADRKGWPLEGVHVYLNHKKIHAKDCEDCEKGGKLDRIERVLDLRGPLDEEQRQRLHQIADRCPVHRTLETGSTVTTTLHDPDVS